jgi:hypothetical protein
VQTEEKEEVLFSLITGEGKIIFLYKDHALKTYGKKILNLSRW